MKNALVAQHGLNTRRNQMGTNIYTSDYEEYISALEKLIEAQNKAKELGALFPLKPGEATPELETKGKKAFQQLNRVYEEYVNKYKMWKDCLKKHGL
jgi:hypothetical protein